MAFPCSVLLVANARLLNTVLGPFILPARQMYCNCTQFTGGSLLIKKKENSRNGNGKETARCHGEGLHLWGTFEDAAHISRVSAAGKKETCGSSAYVLNSLNPV